MLMRNDSVFVLEAQRVAPMRSIRRGPAPSAIPRTRREVALLIDASTAFGRGVLQGAARYNHQAGGWAVCLKSVKNSALDWLHTWTGDGILLLCDDTDVAEAVQRSRTPVVNLGTDLLNHPLPRVEVDPVQVAAVAA